MTADLVALVQVRCNAAIAKDASSRPEGAFCDVHLIVAGAWKELVSNDVKTFSLDVRPQRDFQKSHIMQAYCIKHCLFRASSTPYNA